MTRGKQPTVPTETLAAEYQAGASLREIAKRHDVSFQTLANQLKNAGIERRPKHSRKYYPQPCATCGVVFRPKTATQQYHAPSCVPRKGVMRKTHCKRGHPLSGDNLIPRSGTTPPRCRACATAAQARYDTTTRRDTKLLRRCLSYLEQEPGATGGGLIEDLRARLS